MTPYIIIGNNLVLSKLSHNSAVLDLSLDFVPVDLNMCHVDYHDVAEDVSVAEVMLELVKLRPRFLELSSTSNFPIIHH